MLQEKDEKTCLKAFELLNPDLYDPNCRSYGNVLHIAASFGYTAFVKEVLARGYYSLLKEEGDLMLHDDSSKLSLRPTAIAVSTANFETATQLLQSMEQE